MTLRLPTPWRRLCTHSASSNATIAVLALGTGMVTAMFSAIDTVLWQPLPFDDPDRLVTLHETTANGARTRVALLTLDDWRTRGQSFASLAGYSARTYLATADTATAESFVASVAMTSGDLPAVLGVAILRGRMFNAAEERAGTRLAVPSAAVARRLFGEEHAAIGRSSMLNEEAYTVVGVLSSSFWYPTSGRSPDALIPLDRDL